MSVTDTLSSPPERRASVALITAFLVQTAGALFWAGSAAERINALERTLASDQAAIARVAVLEEQIGTMKQTLERIERKLDRDAFSPPRKER